MRDENVINVKSSQACDMTVLRKFCNMESNYSSLNINFKLSIALLKITDLNCYVSARAYYLTKTAGFMDLVFTDYACFQIDCE